MADNVDPGKAKGVEQARRVRAEEIEGIGEVGLRGFVEADLVGNDDVPVGGAPAPD
jgi:hypothetical protein